ncbi:MAG: hypothetical protein U5O39_05040 [Gammaproteobacteria bacterium]|nr:hypothetical protein [Gammaproteobacteria bacterium]
MNLAFCPRALLLLVSLCPALLVAEVEHSVGIARDEKDERLEYIEHHQYFEDGSHRVDYYSPSMDVIAFKKLTYPTLPQHPRIEQENLRNGTETLVEPLEDTIRMVRQEDGSTTEISVERRPDVVCDAGFDMLHQIRVGRTARRGYDKHPVRRRRTRVDARDESGNHGGRRPGSRGLQNLARATFS